MQSLRRPAELAVLLLVSACAAPRPVVVRPPPPAAGAATGTVKIGKPYQVYGIWYYPADDRGYDQRGVASWYGPGFHALSTANGERYDQDDVTAAHKTLPMPSYVEVENLDNGRRLVVRINDRGPFVGTRIIDLSRKSAQLLGVDRAGLANVRVRRVFPDAMTIAELAPRPVPPPVVPPIATTDVPSVASVAIPGTPATGLFVQVAALGDAGRIAWLSGYLTSFGTVSRQAAPSGLTRIRLGPYADAAAANAALAQLRAAGYTDARLVPAAPAP